jgi:hypothetical protein
MHYGLEESKRLIQPFLNIDVVELIINKLLRTYEFEQNLHQSNYVGYPGELTPKHLLDQIYRGCTYQHLDGDRLCLQLLATLCEPDLFMKVFIGVLNEPNETSLLLDLLYE